MEAIQVPFLNFSIYKKGIFIPEKGEKERKLIQDQIKTLNWSFFENSPTHRIKLKLSSKKSFRETSKSLFFSSSRNFFFAGSVCAKIYGLSTQK